MQDLVMYLLYGAVSGFSRFTPISDSAHRVLFPALLRFDGSRPLLLLFVHLGALGAFFVLYRQRVMHLYQNAGLLTVPPRKRKRPLDADAVRETRLILTASVPALLGAIVGGFFPNVQIGFLPLSLLLLAMAVAVYLPDYLPGGNRRVRAMTPMEGILLGLCAAASAIPGLSAVGLMLSLALLRKCDREYILDIVFIVCAVSLCGAIVADAVRFPISGLSDISGRYVLGCLTAAVGAFGTGVGAISTMRYLAVKTGFSAFAFYNFGLSVFIFILYLVI